MARDYDGVIVGSGPNGLSAAIALARAGWKVLVIEAQDTIGGGARSAELTLPGFLHDVCSAVHPLAVSSPFFRTLPLSEHGLEWIHPPCPVAHPFDDGTAAVLQRSVEHTAESLGDDRDAYLGLMRRPVADWDDLSRVLLGKPQFPEYPLKLARFAVHAVRSITRLAYSVFRTERARALFAGIAAHSNLNFDKRPSAGFGLVLGAAGHAVGWPVPRGGSQRIANALSAYLRSLGGTIVTGTPVRTLDDVPPHRALLCDVTPRQLLTIAGDRLPPAYRDALARYRYAPGAFKLDWALRGPIPWKAPECLQASTVHVGGSMEEMAESERATWSGKAPERPVMIVTQSSLFDAGRAPAGRHTAWAYCHVPNGCTVDMTERMEAQMERFAPGFRDRIIARHVFSPAKLERHNANLIGGDFMAGVQDLPQLLFRPTRHWYSTPVKGLYLCSASTPPGGGVHGMCGFLAAELALCECS